MQVGPDTVVTFHYQLSQVGGAELERSAEGTPVTYLHGHGSLFPALERRLVGQAAGDVLTVTLEPAEAYGLRRENAVQRVPVKHLSARGKLRTGMVAKISTDQGARDVRIVKLGRYSADVDTNHPFAGMSLEFVIQIVDVRAASAEEIAHGHVHGPGGHHH